MTDYTTEQLQEIDALCAEKVMGYELDLKPYKDCLKCKGTGVTGYDSWSESDERCYCCIPKSFTPTKDLNQAFEMLKRLKSKDKISAHYICNNYVKLFVIFPGMRSMNGDCQTTAIHGGKDAIAICLACLEAVGYKYE